MRMHHHGILTFEVNLIHWSGTCSPRGAGTTKTSSALLPASFTHTAGDVHQQFRCSEEKGCTSRNNRFFVLVVGLRATPQLAGCLVAKLGRTLASTIRPPKRPGTGPEQGCAASLYPTQLSLFRIPAITKCDVLILVRNERRTTERPSPLLEFAKQRIDRPAVQNSAGEAVAAESIASRRQYISPP